MSFIGILAAVAGLAVIYVSWSLLKFIFTFFVKIFVFVGMASFVVLLFLIFIGTTITWLADTKAQKEWQTNTYTSASPIQTPKQDYAYGIPVPSRKGFIVSPYINKIIDIRGLAPNTLIKDPYTGKLIMLP
jgi:hypothetical protein